MKFYFVSGWIIIINYY